MAASGAQWRSFVDTGVMGPGNSSPSEMNERPLSGIRSELLKVETRNRASLILLDSNFEIALKEFIVTNKVAFPPNAYGDKQIKGVLGQRTTVIKEVQGKVAGLTPAMVTKAEFYYGLRNKLIHKRTTVPISDREIDDYRQLVEGVLILLFGLSFPVS